MKNLKKDVDYEIGYIVSAECYNIINNKLNSQLKLNIRRDVFYFIYEFNKLSNIKKFSR